MILTYSKKFINILDFKPEDYSIDDVAHSTSNIVRYNGHCKIRYSVSKHACNVASVVRAAGGNAPTIFYATMHDATEAYVGDMPGPLKKKKFPEFAKLEEEIMKVILSTYNEQFGNKDWTKYIDYELVDMVDKSMLLPELNALMPNIPIKMDLGPIYTIPLALVGLTTTTLEQDRDNWMNWHNSYVSETKKYLDQMKIEEEIPF